MTFCTKDHESWMADIGFVKRQVRETKGKKTSTYNNVVKLEYSTKDYDVTEWCHQQPKYSAWLAIAKDNSHTVTWYENMDGIHRW